MTIIHSSDLGWTAGQDISDEFAALAKTLKPGDTFVFDHMYDISGGPIVLANNVTLAGGSPGSGLDVQDVETNPHTNLIILTDSGRMLDMTVRHGDVATPSGQVKITFKAQGDNIQIVNSAFEGNPNTFIRATGDSFSVIDSSFDGASYQMQWLGKATNFSVENSLFQNANFDGIKTLVDGSSTEGTQNATISNSVFMNGRDGIDTTAGFQNSIVNDSYFVNNTVSALDIKTVLASPSSISADILNTNITLTNNEFIGDQRNMIVTTVVDRGPSNGRGVLFTSENEEMLTPNNIHVSGSIFENTVTDAGFSGSFLIKNGHSLTSTDNQFLGNIYAPDTGSKSFSSVTGSVVGQARTPQLDSYYESLAGPDWSDISYPTDGTPTPVDPDPISYTPPDESDQTTDPTPVVEAPVEPAPVVEVAVPDSTPATSASNLLDVFVAYTDTDKTISQIGSNSSIDSSLTEGRSLTIYATSSGNGADIGSVKLIVDGVGSKMENIEPYALFGDNGKGDFFGGKALPEGSYTAELIVFSGRNGTGDVLETVGFDFTVDDTASTPVVTPTVPVVETPVEPDPEPAEVIVPETDLVPDLAPQGAYSQLLDIKLIDTSTDEVLVDLHQGMKLSSDDLSDRKITLSAEAIGGSAGTIGSVRLEMDGQYSRMENVEPYALFGDNNGNFFGGKQLADGIHTATLTVYEGKNGTGSVLEQVNLEFDIGDYDSVIINGSPSTISSYSESQDAGTATVSSDQSAIELEGSAWKAVDLFEFITEETVLKFDFKSDAEGEIQGIGFIDENGDLESTFFQLDGSQELGIQAFNDGYETGSGYQSYTIPVGEYFTGSVEQLVLVSDDDVDIGAMSAFSNIGLIDGIA